MYDSCVFNDRTSIKVDRRSDILMVNGGCCITCTLNQGEYYAISGKSIRTSQPSITIRSPKLLAIHWYGFVLAWGAHIALMVKSLLFSF